MPGDEKKPESPAASSELGRRQFFLRIGLTSVAVSSLGAAVLGYKFLSPNLLYEPSPIVNAGKPDHYPADSVTFDPAAAIYVVHEREGLFAVRAVCTHLACVTAWKPELGVIACPCHGSQFTREGAKIVGPAPQPLPWLRMWLDDQGDLMVDRSIVLTRKRYVKV
jgi:cytochrome b6-f complex iron-sulfur subunit